MDGRLLIDSSNISNTREELREMARAFSVQRGRNKVDTIKNLILSGKVKIVVIKK